MSRVDATAGQLELLPARVESVPLNPVVRIVVPCSNTKATRGPMATQSDLDWRRAEIEARLSDFARPARDLYVGRAYKRSLQAVDNFAVRRPDLPVALHIASAGYGIVDSDDLLVPYEAVMGSGVRRWMERGRAVGMPEQALALVESCNLTIFALSEPYLVGAGVATMEPRAGFGVAVGVGRAPVSPRIREIRAGRPQARALGTTERDIASVVLDLLLHQIAEHGPSIARELPVDPLDWASP